MRHCLTAFFAPLLLLGASACDPGVSRPGAWLSGEEVGTTVADWTFTNAYEDCYLETATWYVVPHSVTLWCAVHEGDLYVGSFSMSGGWEGYRTWENHIARGGEGAARFGGKIYRGTWERVEDRGLLEAVERSYAAKYSHTETWKQGLAVYDPRPEWRFYRFRQDSPTMTYQGREIPRAEEAILDPEHTVLVIHEMLNDFVSKGGAADKAGLRYAMEPEIERIARLLAAARAKNVRVAHVRWTRFGDGSTDDDASCATGSRVCSGRRTKAGRTRPAANIEGSWGWQAPDAIAPAPGDWVLPKWRQDAFFSTQLDALMRWNGIKTMVIVGLGTEVGIVPSVMTASELGYFTVVVDDAIKEIDSARKEPAMAFLRDTAMVRNANQVEEIWNNAAAAPAGIEPTSSEEPPSKDLLSGNAVLDSAPEAAVSYRGHSIPTSEAEVFDPKHTLLLVHDMQNDFIGTDGAFEAFGQRVEADGILKPVAKLLAGAREKNVRVAYTRWTNYADGSSFSGHLPGGPLARPSATGPRRWALERTSGWEIVDAVRPLPDDWKIRKYRPDAFYATPLDSLMRWNGIRTLVIVGIGAEGGVLPTLMSASNLGYFTVAVSDCLALPEPGRVDDAMRYIADAAIVRTHEELLDIWRDAAPKPVE